MKGLERRDMRAVVRKFVWYMRRRDRVAVTPGYKPEGSCFAHGEFNNLLWCQLVSTPEGQAGWQELQDENILRGVYRVAVWNIRYYGQRARKERGDAEKLWARYFGRRG